MIHGKYRENMDKWSERLKPGHLFVGFFDAVVHQPDRLLESLAGFLNAGGFKIHPRANVSSGVEMPEPCLELAAHFYRDEIRKLSDRYGGYFSEWLGGALVSSVICPVCLIR
jgi:hypothetical protein